MNRLLASLTAFAFAFVALAGCTGGGSESDEAGAATPHGSSDGHSGDSDPPTDPGGPPTSDPPATGGPDNQAPTAALTASVTTGTAPLSVEFTVAGDDPDGDALFWSLDADGDGSEDASGEELPDNYTHAFEAGNYTAALTLTDGELTETVSVDLVVGAAAGPRQLVTGSYTVGGPVECAYGFVPEAEDAAYLSFDVVPETIGLEFVATFTFAAPGVPAVDFFGEGGDYLATHGGSADPAGYAGKTEVRATVPDGALTGYLYSCGGVDVDVAYEVA